MSFVKLESVIVVSPVVDRFVEGFVRFSHVESHAGPGGRPLGHKLGPTKSLTLKIQG
jgi:hypothetical protein